MAMMNVEIISREIIKPSSPTPHDLRNHKRSFLDQLAPTTYIPIILFYRPKINGHHVDHQVQRSSRLKKSLEQTLNRFYPLAGSVKEDHSIDCNDEGVEYYEARVACNLSQVLQHINVEALNKFQPFEPYRIKGAKPGSREVLLAVQYNMFDCGGVAISPHDELDRGSNYGILASKLSNALKEIDGDYVKKLQTDAIPESLTKSVELFSKGEVEFYKFTSWCRFPLYEADFGFGEPTWVCSPSMPFKNLVVLMSTRDGHGIEAIVNILEEDAVVFDSNEELLPFVSWTIN
jgi:hypothetical protein